MGPPQESIQNYSEALSRPCEYCGSANTTELTSETNIHFPRAKDLGAADAGFFVFPLLSTCMDCGSVRFVLKDDELHAIRERLASRRQTDAALGLTWRAGNLK